MDTNINDFKNAVLKALPEARKSGQITLADALKVRLALNRPKIVEEAYQIANDQYHAENPSHNGKIDWSSIKDFIIGIFPLVLQLLQVLHVV